MIMVRTAAPCAAYLITGEALVTDDESLMALGEEGSRIAALLGFFVHQSVERDVKSMV